MTLHENHKYIFMGRIGKEEIIDENRSIELIEGNKWEST